MVNMLKLSSIVTYLYKFKYLKNVNNNYMKKNKTTSIDTGKDIIIDTDNINNINDMKNLIIDSINNLFFIGDIVKKTTKSKGKWKVDYKCDKNIQNKENGRIYLIVVDDQIYKIGSSACKGGIKNTLSFYEGGLGGSPSLRTFGIHMLIQEQLDIGKKIKIYVMFIEPIRVVINGLLTSIEKITYPQIKDMENVCREDYKKIYGKYPIWNFQENVEEFPKNIKLAYRQKINDKDV